MCYQFVTKNISKIVDWFLNWQLTKGRISFKSTCSFGTVFHLKGSFLSIFAGFVEVKGAGCGKSVSESDSETLVSSSVSDSRLGSGTKSVSSSLSEDKSLSSEISGFDIGLAGTFFLE